MKWLIGCLLALMMVSSVMAGEDPYIAIVGNDITANTFYLSPKYVQFLLDQTPLQIPFASPYEAFAAQNALIQPEICDTLGAGTGLHGINPPFTFRGRNNARVTAGNAGFYQWTIALPKKPVGEINLCIQCGVIKPNTFADLAFSAVEFCAAETGEFIGNGFCSHESQPPGTDVINPAALPTITAQAFPGNFADLSLWIPAGTTTVVPFNLTAFRNPGTYTLAFTGTGIFTGAINPNAASSVALNGSDATRILLKSCMDKCILVKLPVEGQLNGLLNPPTAPVVVAGLPQVEHDLVEGDRIVVRMRVPRANTVDIYCHDQSLRLMGIGESPF